MTEQKKIYWICGHLAQEERDQDFLKYGLKLNQVLQAEATRRPGLAEFKFVNVYSCTKREFAKIWSDPNTYGIFWNSHGDQYGRPQADPDRNASTRDEELRSMDLDPRSRVYIARSNTKEGLKREVANLSKLAATAGMPYIVKGYDERRVVTLEDGRYELEVLAAGMPAASPNLKFVTFMSCWIGKQEAAWKNLMPPGARIPGFPEKNSTAPGTRRGWIDDWIDRLKVPQGLMGLLTAGKSKVSDASEMRTPLPHPIGGRDLGLGLSRNTGGLSPLLVLRSQMRSSLNQSSARLSGFDTRLYNRSLALASQTRIGRIGLDPSLATRISTLGTHIGGLSTPPDYSSVLKRLGGHLGTFNTGLGSSMSPRFGGSSGGFSPSFDKDEARRISTRLSTHEMPLVHSLSQSSARLSGFDTRLYDKSLALASQTRIGRIGLDPSLATRINALGTHVGGLSTPPDSSSVLRGMSTHLGSFDTSLSGGFRPF